MYNTDETSNQGSDRADEIAMLRKAWISAQESWFATSQKKTKWEHARDSVQMVCTLMKYAESFDDNDQDCLNEILETLHSHINLLRKVCDTRRDQTYEAMGLFEAAQQSEIGES